MITLITDNSLRFKLTNSQYDIRLKALLKNGLKRIIIRDDKNIDNQMDTLLGIHHFAYDNQIEIFINCKIEDFHIFKDIKGVTGIHLSGNNIHEAISSGAIKNFIFGTSAHNMDEVESVIDLNPYYVLVSPVYSTVCKLGVEPLGLEKGHDLYKRLSSKGICAIALGGINSKNISNCPMNIKCFKESAIRSLFYDSDNLEKELLVIMDAINNKK